MEQQQPLLISGCKALRKLQVQIKNNHAICRANNNSTFTLFSYRLITEKEVKRVISVLFAEKARDNFQPFQAAITTASWKNNSE